MKDKVFRFFLKKRKGVIMIVISSLIYPTESANEIAKRFMEAPALPDFLTRKGPYISASQEKGILTVSLWEMDNSRLAEGMVFIGNYLAIFFGVPGFKYEIAPFFEITEALKMIGMG